LGQTIELLIIIMTRFTPRLISTNNWNQLVFDFSQIGGSQINNKICHLPDERLLSDLFFPWGWHPPTRYHLENYLNPRHPSEKSFHLCQAYSNCAVNHILLRYSDPSQSIFLLKEHQGKLCENLAFSYEELDLSLVTLAYLNWMYPKPTNYEKSLREVLPFYWIKEVEDIPSEAVKKAIYKDNCWGNMLASRFPTWQSSFKMSKKVSDAMKLSDEYQTVIKAMVKQTESRMKEKRKLKNKQKISAKGLPEILDIRQCWFCGEFYLSPISQNNNYSRYCDDPSCKRSHNAWIQCLKRKGETPASLGL
jgi:hypothetical protein